MTDRNDEENFDLAAVYESANRIPATVSQVLNLDLPDASMIRRTLQAAGQLAEATAFIAESMASTAGFGWSAEREAPGRYEDLSIAYEYSKSTFAPLPVSSLNCVTTVFTDPIFNLAARFWHDLTHVRLGSDFSEAGEAAVAAAQLYTIRLHGFEPKSPAYQVLAIETNGQDRCLRELGHYPSSQLRFTVRAFEMGVDYAIACELDDAIAAVL